MRRGGGLLGALVNLNHPDHYLHWGFILISVANLVVIAIMISLFVAAIALPFLVSKDLGNPDAHDPGHCHKEEGSSTLAPEEQTWTGGLRRIGLRFLPPSKLLPDSQPAYVASWVYVFGVLSVAGLVAVIATGLVLAIEGPAWWHTSVVGHFVNSLHLWSVELFMGFMAIHLWAKYWMAAWRGRRQLTWITGVAAFLIAVFEAFTGYLSQTNFDSQWIAFESKDAFNAGGAGEIVNPMNFGQALMLHISLVPLVLVAVVGLHVLLVRVRGVVPPIDARCEDLGVGSPAGDGHQAGPPAGIPSTAGSADDTPGREASQ